MSGAELANTAARLNELLAEAGQAPLAPDLAARFAAYYALLLRWNARVNLTAIRDEEGILRRHFVESIFCARSVPEGVCTFLDFGSGAGFPGIPVAMCRPEIRVTLAESQGKKMAFLREALRVLRVSGEVYSHRAEALERRFDCVGMRAVDRMASAVAVAAGLIASPGWLALLTTLSATEGLREAAGNGFCWAAPVAVAEGSERVLLIGRRR